MANASGNENGSSNVINGGDIQVSVKFTLANDLESRINSLFEEVKASVEGKFKKAIKVDLPVDVNPKTGKVNTLPNASVKLAQQLQKGLKDTTVKADNVKFDLKSFDNAAKMAGSDVSKYIQTNLSKGFKDGIQKLKIDSSALKMDKIATQVGKNLKDSIGTNTTQVFEQMQKQIKDLTTKAAQMPSFVDPTSGKIKSDTSSKELRAYAEAEAKKMKDAADQYSKAISAADKSLTKTGKADFSGLESANQQIQALKKSFQELAAANSSLFSGQSADAHLASALANITAQAEGAQNAFANLNAKSDEIKASSAQAKEALTGLSNALKDLNTATAKYKAAQDNTLTSKERSQLIADADKLRATGTQSYNEHLNTQYSLTAQDMKQVEAVARQVASALDQSTAAMNKTDAATVKLRTSYTQLASELQKLQTQAAGLKDVSLQNSLTEMSKGLTGSINQGNFSTKELDAFVAKFREMKVEVAQLSVMEAAESPASAIKQQVTEVKNLYDQMKSIMAQMKSTEIGSGQFSDLASQLEKVEAKAKEAHAVLNQLVTDNQQVVSENSAIQKSLTSLDTSSLKFDGATAGIKQVQEEYQKLAGFAERYAEIQNKITSAKSLSGSELNSANNEIRSSLEQINTEYQNFLRNRDSATTKLGSSFKEFATLDKSVSSAFKDTNKYLETSERQAAKLETQYRKLLETVQNYKTAHASLAGTKFETNLSGIAGELDNSLKTGNLSTSGLEDIKGKFAAIKAEIAGTTDVSRTFGASMKELAGTFTMFFGTYQLVSTGVSWIKQMVDYTKELDHAMTELRKVTDESQGTYDSFLDNAASKAIDLGAKLSDVVTSTGDFARLGYSLSEAFDLSQAAITLKNVGDGIQSISESSEMIISAMKAFDIPAENAMQIVDIYNKVGNEFAISTEGIAKAMERSAASLSQAGNSIQESVGLAVGKITADMYLSAA